MPTNNIIDRTRADALIPVEETAVILQSAVTQSAVLSLARRLPNMNAKQRTQPVLDSLPYAYFVNGDTGLKQTTDISWDNVAITAEELGHEHRTLLNIYSSVAGLDDCRKFHPIRWDIMLGKAVGRRNVVGNSLHPVT